MISPNKPVLTIETATSVCSVALRAPGGEIHEERAEGRGVHSEMTFVFIDRLLKQAGLQVSSLGAVMLSAGPGSYTGLRVGSSAVKGLLFQTDIPLIAYNTLAGIALGTVKMLQDEARSWPADGPVVDAVIDARRSHLYHQRWRFAESGEILGTGAGPAVSGRPESGTESGSGSGSGSRSESGSGTGSGSGLESESDSGSAGKPDGGAGFRSTVWADTNLVLIPETGVEIRELEEVLQRWTSGGMVAGTGTGRLPDLAGAGGIDTGGLIPFPGSDVISAKAVLEYVTGKAGSLSLQNVKESGRRSGSWIRSVDPASFEPEYVTGQ